MNTVTHNAHTYESDAIHDERDPLERPWVKIADTPTGSEEIAARGLISPSWNPSAPERRESSHDGEEHAPYAPCEGHRGEMEGHPRLRRRISPPLRFGSRVDSEYTPPPPLLADIVCL